MTGKRCPRDEASLLHYEQHGVVMYRCFFCEGAFLDAAALAGIHRLASAFVGDDPDLDLPESALSPCPGCSGTMRSRWFSQRREILLDQCRGCGGIWLDTDELQKIMHEIYKLK